MMESKLLLANKRLQASLKRSRMEEGAESSILQDPSSPPSTPGMPIQADEEMYYSPATDAYVGEGAIGREHVTWFRPPYLLDSAHSYFNDGESFFRLAANIVTPANEEFLGSLGLERWCASCWSSLQKKWLLPCS